jgi:virginiamycin B lyase
MDNNRVGYMTPGGKYATYPVPTPNVRPLGIALGPDGAMWFAEYSGPNIGRVDSTGKVAEYAIPPHPGTPQWIARGPDDGMWFTEFGGGPSDIGRLGLH